MCPTQNPQREPCFHPQQDVVCSKQQMWLLMLQLAWGNSCLRAWQEHRVLTNQTFAFWKCVTDKGLAHCVWWEQKIWNALSCSETKFLPLRPRPSRSEHRHLSLVPARADRSTQSSAVPLKCSSSFREEVWDVRSSLFNYFAFRASKEEENVFIWCSCNPALDRTRTEQAVPTETHYLMDYMNFGVKLTYNFNQKLE